MLERLDGNRVYLYKSEMQVSGNVKWKLIRKLSKFPDFLMQGSKYLNIVSPDFSRYIDVD